MARCTRLGWNLFVPLLCAVPAMAQWRQVPAVGAPSVRSGFSLLPYPNGGLLLFGGDENNAAATEWRWSGTEWAPLLTPVPRRSGQAAAVHTPTGDLFVFGGLGAGAVPLTDTWRLQGSTWTQVQATNSPPFFGDSSMAYDARSDAMVLVGRSGSAPFATWSFQGGDWSPVPTAVLPATANVQLFADAVRGEVGAFAVEPSGLVTYLLQGGAWNAVATANGTFVAGTGSFDTARGRAVWFTHPVGQPGQTYEWDGLRLYMRPSPIAPPVLGGAAMAMAWHGARGETVLVASTFQLDVWSWAPQPAALASAYGTPCVDPQLQLGLVPGDTPQPGARHRLQVAGASGSALVFSLIGLSHTNDGAPLPRPFPFSVAGCQQRVQILAPLFLGVGLPASLQITVPNAIAFLGFRYDAQFVFADATGIVDATNGLEVQVGLPVAESVLEETFADDTLRDARVSGDPWNGGAVVPVALGGDGRHGSFDPAFGTMVSATQFVWNTDLTVIPASATLSGVAETVTDGRFFFTDFVLPAGTTVDFTGTVPAQIFVRGKVDLHGTMRGNGAAMTTFNARGSTLSPAPFVLGQAGGAGGAGGGRGGNGGNEYQHVGSTTNTTPIAPGASNHGQNGEDVRLLAGHAYAANAIGTGGTGSSMHPSTGTWPIVNTPQNPAPLQTPVNIIYRMSFARGGGGGGFAGPGTTATNNPFAQAVFGPVAAAGLAFNLFPYPPLSAPPGYSSLNHFLVGGSGGGGGGTHAFGTTTLPSTGDVFVAGAGGSGGGGGFALRAGNDLTVATSASLQAKGGAGVQITGRDPAIGGGANANFGVASPGGGGSGGSFLLQSGTSLHVDGTIDTSGGAGSTTGNIATSSFRVTSSAGAGATGFFRLEAAGMVHFAGTSFPTYNAATNSGPLTDRDDRTGSRSLWLRPPTTELPRYVRYELLADLGGSTVLFSDDPLVSSLAANDPSGAVFVRFQGARIDPITGQVQAATAGPWRTKVIPGTGSVNQDRAEALRFDLVLDKRFGAVSVRELRIVWR